MDDLAQNSIMTKAAGFAGSISAWCEAAHSDRILKLWNGGNAPPIETISTLGGTYMTLGFLYKKINNGHGGGYCRKSKDKEQTVHGADTIT